VSSLAASAPPSGSFLPPGKGPLLEPSGARRVPRPPTWPGFLAALLMHGALVGYLWFAVQWHTSAVAPAVAVLWDLPLPADTVPPPPAPPAPTDTPPPPPPKEETPAPPKPDIVQKTEKAPKKEKAQEPPKAPPVKKDVKPPPLSAKELKRQQQDAERQHQQEMARLASQVGTPGPTAVPQLQGRLSTEYEARVRAAVLANVHYAPPEDTSDSQYADVVVNLLPTGELAGEPRLVHPSNLPGWDDAVIRAILLTDPFPRQADGSAPRSMTLRFRPTDVR
jgi:colicin import membrane protein